MEVEYFNDGNQNLVDDLYFSALCDEDELFPISDEKYAEQLQFQEALMSSVVGSTNSDESETNENHFRRSKREIKGKRRETGQSSKTFCGICMDAKPHGETFLGSSCTGHTFCEDCMAGYIAMKIQENIAMVKCPDPKCKEILEPHHCRSIVPKQVLDRWEDALCESAIMGSQKFYCPFKDCSALLIDDGDEVLTTAECPFCRRLFCVQCKVAWHEGVGCREFQNLRKDERGREDIMVMELAKSNQWKRCPSCRFYVEKKDGCAHITCRCGYQFCYGCGLRWNQTHSCTVTVTGILRQ